MKDKEFIEKQMVETYIENVNLQIKINKLEKELEDTDRFYRVQRIKAKWDIYLELCRMIQKLMPDYYVVLKKRINL